MLRLGLSLSLLAFAGCATTSPGSISLPQNGVNTAPVDVTALDFPPLRDVALPEVQEVELPNGLTLYITEDHSLPRVNISARIGVGSAWEPADKVGLASITGSVMRSGGTASLTPDELNLALENVGASIETGIGEDSGSAFMSTLSEHLDTVLPLFADVLMNPAFDETQVELAKTRAKSNISRRNDNPQGIATRELFKLVFGEDSPYARDAEYWTIDAISRDDLVTFHHQYFHPNNTSLAIWGDFDAAEMAEKIRTAFADWQRMDGFGRPEAPPVNSEREHSIHFIQKDDVTQSTVLIGHPGEIRLDHPDYFAVLVMNEVLGGGFASRLFQTVRTDLGLAYAVWGQYSADYETSGLFYSGTFTKSESTTEGVRAVLDVIETMRTTPPSEAELLQAKESFLNSFVFNFDTKQEVLNRRMTYDYYGYPEDFIQQIKSGVEAVTAADVQRVAQRYLHPDEARIVVLGNATDFSEPLSVLGDVQDIDITIPLAPEGAEVPQHSGDASEGMALLERAQGALGGVDPFRAIEAIGYESESEQGPSGQAVTIESVVSFVFPDQIHAVQQLPGGEITIVVDGQEGQIMTPMGSQAAPTPLIQQIHTQSYFELPYLLARASTQTLEAMEDQDGLHVLSISAEGQPAPFFLYIDPDTFYPTRMVGTVVGPQGPVEVTIVFADFRNVDGLLLPHEATQFAAGEQTGRTVYTSIEINPEIPNGLFDLGE